jgi:hypothetical protein
MPEMKRNRSDLRRPLVQLFVGELAAPTLQIFPGEFQGVQNGAMNAREFRKGAAQPWLRKFVLRHSR